MKFSKSNHEEGKDSIGQDMKDQKEESSSPYDNKNNNRHHPTNFYHEQNHDNNNNDDDIYDYYLHNLIPALTSSLPILCYKLIHDAYLGITGLITKIWLFLVPSGAWNSNHSVPPWLLLPWNMTLSSSSSTSDSDSMSQGNAVAEFMLRYFDKDHDGHISASELLHIQDMDWPPLNPETLHQYLQSHNLQLPKPHYPESLLEFFQHAWPMTDWKIGVFLWRTCGGLIIIIAIATIVPGKLHGLSGRILRWPILALTYFMIAVELVVYVLIRLFIKAVETIFAHSHHRSLRHAISQSKTYDEWYTMANMLDISQKRVKWKCTTVDDTRSRYNWSFIEELISDMRKARQDNDSLMALAVLKQCTRKNVGGVMSEDLFTYMNTGEPKSIVREFVNEVVLTLRWVTDQARKIPVVKPQQQQERAAAAVATAAKKEVGEEEAKKIYEEKLRGKVKQERNKIHEHLLSWATLTFFGNEGEQKDVQSDDNDEKKKPDETTTDTISPKKEENVAEEKDNDDNHVSIQTRSLSDVSDGSSNNSDHQPTPSTPPRDDVSTSPIRPRLNSTSSSASVLPPLHRETVKTFLKRARAAYGRTALCLSGGAAMGSYHFGSAKALFENDALPHIISGTSAGSAIGALMCTRTDDEIRRDLRPEMLADKLGYFSRPWRERIKSVWNTGCMFDNDEWLSLVKWFTCGDLTFEEAYRKTGRVLCITLSATTKKAPPVLLNYVTAPDVVIASAIVASAAVPGFIKPVLLQVKGADGVVRRQEANKDQTYWDGSIEQDIPTAGLAEMLNCQFFLAAQANPHIVPFFYNSKGDVGRPSRWSRGMKDDSWRGGFLLSALELYIKCDMRAKFHFLNELEAAVGFTSTLMTQVYGGTTTIVPQVCLKDYFRLFCNPNFDDLQRYFQGGSVAAYQHIAMVKLHYEIANALDECLDSLESDEVGVAQKPPRRLSQLNLQNLKKGAIGAGVATARGKEKEYSLTSSTLRTLNNDSATSKAEVADGDSGSGKTESCDTSVSGDCDEIEIGGFEGVECAFTPRRLSVKPKND